MQVSRKRFVREEFSWHVRIIAFITILLSFLTYQCYHAATMREHLLASPIESSVIAEVGTYAAVETPQKRSSEWIRQIFEGRYEDYLVLVRQQSAAERLSWTNFKKLHRKVQSIRKSFQHWSEIEWQNFLAIGVERAHQVIFQHQQGTSLLARHIHADATQLLEEILPIIDLGPLFFLTHDQSYLDQFLAIPSDSDYFLKVDIGLLFFSSVIASEKDSHGLFAGMTYNDRTFDVIKAMRDMFIMARLKGAPEALERYADARAKLIGIDIRTPLNRFLLRLSALMGIVSGREGFILKHSLLKMRPEDLSIIIQEFNSEENELYNNQTLRCFLETLIASPKFGASKHDRLTLTIQLGLPFVAKAAHQHRELKKSIKTLSLDFSQIIGTIQNHPELLVSGPIEISSEGRVVVLVASG